MRHEVQVELIRRLLDHELSRERIESTRLPVAPYRSADQLERERAALFHRFPTPIAHASDIARPGDVATREVAGLPVMAVRDRSDDVHAFVNVCRHRGSRLVDEPRGTGCKALVCPYHGWVYGLDGGLVHVPGEAFFPDLDRAALGLLRLPCTVAHGFVWVVPDAKASTGSVDVDGYLGPIADDLHHFDMASHELYRRTSAVRDCNWKLIIDAFLEGYHLRTLHRDSLYRFFGDAGVHFEFFDRHVRSVGARKNIADETRKPTADWDIRACTTPFYLVFPSTIVVVHPRYISVLTVSPVAVDRTAYTHYMLAPHSPRTHDDNQHAERSFALIDGVVFQNEDMAIAESIQRGFGAETYDHFVLGAIEYPIRVFHDHIARLVAG